MRVSPTDLKVTILYKIITSNPRKYYYGIIFNNRLQRRNQIWKDGGLTYTQWENEECQDLPHTSSQSVLVKTEIVQFVAFNNERINPQVLGFRGRKKKHNCNLQLSPEICYECGLITAKIFCYTCVTIWNIVDLKSLKRYTNSRLMKTIKSKVSVRWILHYDS